MYLIYFVCNRGMLNAKFQQIRLSSLQRESSRRMNSIRSVLEVSTLDTANVLLCILDHYKYVDTRQAQFGGLNIITTGYFFLEGFHDGAGPRETIHDNMLAIRMFATRTKRHDQSHIQPHSGAATYFASSAEFWSIIFSTAATTSAKADCASVTPLYTPGNSMLPATVLMKMSTLFALPTLT